MSAGYRDTPEGKRQAEALSALEKRSGRKRSEIVAELPMEHDQYKRYLRGDGLLRWDLIPQFARAYRVPPSDIVRALGLIDQFDMAEYLRGKIPQDRIDAATREWDSDDPAAPADQKSIADELIRGYQAQAAKEGAEMLERQNRPA